MLDRQPNIKRGGSYIDLSWVFLAAKFAGRTLEEFQQQLNQLIGVAKCEYERENGVELVACTIRLPSSSECDVSAPASIF
jgi:hypothetical protein